jgi:putative FmdB family regulatory protein
MSPIYEYHCDECGRTWEQLHSIDDRNEEQCCGQDATLLISVGARPVIYEYYSENLESQITGPKQKAHVMREKGVECVG